jgi:hypothetical protein
VDARQIRQPGKQPDRVQARSIVCYLAVSELAATNAMLSRELGIGPTAVSKAVARGKRLANLLRIGIESE